MILLTTRCDPCPDSLDEEMDKVTRREKKMQTSGKVYTLVHDRRTHRTLKVLQGGTRLPALDLSQIQGDRQQEMGGAGRISCRKKAESQAGKLKMGVGGRDSKAEEGPLTCPSRMPDIHEQAHAMASPVSARPLSKISASEQVLDPPCTCTSAVFSAAPRMTNGLRSICLSIYLYRSTYLSIVYLYIIYRSI